MSIVDPPRAFTRDGLQIKVRRPSWNENDHPRDREGRFIETGAEVRIWGGSLAKVVRNVGGGRIEIQRADGSHAFIHRNYLTVVKRPDGSSPTSKRTDNIAALPEAPATPGAVALPEPTKPLDINTMDIGDGLDHFLRAKDKDLADRVSSVAADYQAAVGNGIPNDEADERARLITALDEVDQKYSDDRRIAAMSTALRAEATHEPDGSPDAPGAKPPAAATPTPGVPDKPATPSVPAAKPKTEPVASRFINDGDVLHTRMGRVTVAGQPQKQPNGSYALHLDRGDGKPPVQMVMGSRDRADREIAPAAPAAPAAVDNGPVTVRPAGTPDPGFPIPKPADAPAAAPVEDQIRAAYRSLSTDSGSTWVGLAKLRQQLPGVSREEMDAALQKLSREQGIHVQEEANQQALTPEDRAAAVRFGGSSRHLLKIDDTNSGAQPKPDVPKVPNIPKAPERRHLDGFSPAESAMIHNAVEDYAAQYFGGPMGLSNSDSARYVSEGHLKDLVATHGLRKVWGAVASVIDADSSVQTRTQEERDKNKADRVARLEALNQSAGAAAQAENWDVALQGLDQMESIDPTYRPAGMAIDDLRGRINAMRGTQQQDTTPDKTPGPSAPTPAALEDIHVGDVLDYGGREFTVTTSEPDNMDPSGRSWSFAAVGDNGTPLNRRGPRDSTWPRVREAAPDSAGGGASANAPDVAAPGAAAPTVPDATPATPDTPSPDALDASPLAQEIRNAADDRALAGALRTARGSVIQTGDNSAGAALYRAALHLDSGERDQAAEQMRTAAGAIRALAAGHPSIRNNQQRQGRLNQIADAVEARADTPATDLPAASLNAPDVAAPGVSAPTVPDATPNVPDAPPARQPRFATLDAVRAWLRGPGSIPEQARNDPKSVERFRAVNERISNDPNLVLSDNGRLMVHRNPADGGKKEWRVSSPANGMGLGTDAGTAGTRDEALRLANLYEAHVDADGNPVPWDQDNIGSQVRTWKDQDGVSLPQLLKSDRNKVSPTRSKPADWKDPWARGEAPQVPAGDAAVPPAAQPDVQPSPDVAAPDTAGDPNVDEPAVPPADAVTDTTPPPAAGRWNLAPVTSSGDPEADKRALAASLRAAARASTNASDRAALNWAARQLVPPAPRAPRVGAPNARPTTRSPQRQARAQADSDVTLARRASKPPVSAEARMQALADLADELDRLGLGGIAVTPSAGGGDGGGSGSGGGTSIVAVLRGYVAEYKKRRAEVDSGATPGDSGANQGGTDGAASDTGGGALPQVPAGDVQGSNRPGDVLPQPGDGSGAADRRPGGPASGTGPAAGGLPSPGSAPQDSAPVGGGTGDQGNSPDRPRDSGNGTGTPGDGLPVNNGPAGPAAATDTGGPGPGSGDTGLPGRGDGTGGDANQPAAPAEPTRIADAGLAADGVTEADQPAPKPADIPTTSAGGQDFQPQGVDDFAPAGKVGKLNANIAALRTLRTLQQEKRPATPEEQAVLAKWAGWGGLPEVFDEHRGDFAPQRAELRGLLSDSEWREAQRNTLNAHYTDARVVQEVWNAVGALGFNGGRVLEPGSGSGTFIGFAPNNADMVGVELDSTTAALSQYLYPNAHIRNESFARTNVPDGSFDMTIGNVPFGKFPLTDRRHNPTNESIHNHFILKSLALTRPGGLVAVLTSRHTLDNQNPNARRMMAEKGDLVGAVRLPTGSHQRASGTDVIEDLLIFRVREPGAAPQADQSWVTSTKKPIDDQVIYLNDYWDNHPENVLGTMHSAKGQYGTGDLTVRGDRDMTDLPAVLAGIVDQARSDGLVASASTGPRADLVAADESRHDGHIQVEADGTFTQAVSGGSVPFEVSAAQRPELASLVGLRDTLSRLLDAEASSRGITPEITSLRAQLNTQYDAYVAKNGPINRFKLTAKGVRIRPKQGGFRADPMSAIVRALESYDPSDGSAEKASIFTKRAVAPRELRTTTDDPADAISLSVDTYGEVNLPAIANMLGTDEATARERLGTHVFEEPPTHAVSEVDRTIAAGAGIDSSGDILAAAGIDAPSFTVPAINVDAIGTPGRLEPSAAYLSGNVRRKLAIAQAAAAVDPRFQANVDALKAVIPTDLGADEIDARLGAAWIDKDTVQQFLKELIQDRYNDVRVSHSGGSIWTVDGPNWGNLSTEVWGTQQRSASQIVQALLEQRSIKITKKNPDGEGSSPDLEATLAAQQKAAEIQERFSEWLWEDPDRARKMQGRYNDQFNALVLRQYDGSGRTFPGMAESFNPREHQRNAVERIVNEPTAMLAHVVGAGKTAEMVIGTAELKRLGMARKPAIVVPNHMLEQFTREYLEIYPQAKLLAAGSEDLRGDGRREFVGRAATGDWDAVILTQGAFESVPMSQEQQQAYIDREMATMRAQLQQAQADEVAARVSGEYAGSKNQQKTVKKMETALLRAEEALKKKMDKQKDVGVSFEQTGIDYLMVDEAHGYSNLRTLSNIQGAAATGSDKATDLHMKMEYLRETSQSGRVATFATGTPIRNTVTQAYVMQKFLRPDLLEEAGINSFDQWASTFGETVDSMELKPEGTGFRQTTRFAKFRNVPEFLKMFHTFADVKMAEDLKLPTPDLVGGKATTVTVPSSDALAEYIQELGQRADDVRSGVVEPEEDNMLKISGDGRKAALSMKLVGGDHEPGKIEAAADRIASIWQENKGNVYTDPDTGAADPINGGMQIVFLDMGTPGSEDRWNGYDALKKELTARGMDPSTVRYVHEAKNDAQKAEMFAAARAGRISVLIGSSEKMGVGTNMQRRAVALHHLDAPWRPADVEQRDGRIMRQGNLNKDIQILRYVTEGSFDAYMWQTLERKAKFINQIMRGSLDVREIDDIGDTAMSYGEIKALATGNPDLLEKAKTDTELTKLERLERAHNRTQTNMKSDIATQTRNAQTWESYAAQYDTAVGQRVNTRGEAFIMGVDGRKFNKRADAADAFRGRLSSIMSQDRWGEGPERDLGTIGGFTITGQVVMAPGGNREIAVRFSGVPGEVTRVKTDDLGLSGIGLVTRLESSLEAFEAKRDRFMQSAADARVEVLRMEARLGAGFPRAAELEAVRLRSQRINMKIDRDARRSNGEDIPFDPLVDSSQFDAPLPGEGDIAPDEFGAVTGADLRRAAEARANAQKTLAVVNGRIVVKLVDRKVAA